MKMKIAGVLCALTIIVLPSCEKQVETDLPMGYMLVGIDNEMRTKADPVGQEDVMNDVQLLVFKAASGELEAYHSFTDDELSEGKADAFPVAVGSYHIYAVANGPLLSSIADEDELKGTAITLSEYNDPDDDFVMCKSKLDVNVESGKQTAVSLALEHYVARLRVTKVTNKLKNGKSLTLDNIFLSNVVGNDNLAADATPSTWYNAQGVLDRNASKIVGSGSNAAQCPKLTFADKGVAVDNDDAYETVSYLYGYRNGSSVTPAGFTSSFTGEKSAVVVTATISGTTYYYPVVIDALERNKSYDVALTITGSGSTDPDLPVSRGSMSVTVTVAPWGDGSSYNEEI